jgi:hypothetical protein
LGSRPVGEPAANVALADARELDGRRKSGVYEDFKAYRIERHLQGDFGQGSDGVLIYGPGGVIGIGVGPPPGSSNDDSLRTITAIAVGDTTHASFGEVGCT